jgi:hypothetical protein
VRACEARGQLSGDTLPVDRLAARERRVSNGVRPVVGACERLTVEPPRTSKIRSVEVGSIEDHSRKICAAKICTP